jgi:hypothetical protein
LHLKVARKYRAFHDATPQVHQINYSLGFNSQSGWSGSWSESASSSPGSSALVRVCPCFALMATVFRCCWRRAARLVSSAPDSWTRIILQVQIALLVLLRPTCQLGLRILGGLEAGEGFIVGSHKEQTVFQVKHVLLDIPNQMEAFLSIVEAPLFAGAEKSICVGEDISRLVHLLVYHSCHRCWRRIATGKGDAKFVCATYFSRKRQRRSRNRKPWKGDTRWRNR